MSIAKSSNEKKISLHVLTFGIRLSNIAKASVFTELIRKKLSVGLQKQGIIDNIANRGPSKSFSLRMIWSPKYDEKTDEHVRVKKPIRPKDGTIFEFMIHLPNDESEVIDSPLLIILKAEIGRYSNINNVTTDAKFELVETLL